jgi:hypothetical protein
MSKQLQLSVDNPCHQNWDEMSPAEKGRFCSSCEKQVIDFTNMSDSQLAVFFKKSSSASVCGRFFQDQLDRNIEVPKKRIPWLKYFFQILLPAFLASAKVSGQSGKLTMGKPVAVVSGKNKLDPKQHKDTIPTRNLLIPAPIKIPEINNEALRNMNIEPPALPTSLTTCNVVLGQMTTGILVLDRSPRARKTVKGMITNMTGKKISFASVKVKEDSYLVYSNEKGKFSFRVAKGADSVTLIISHVGYKPKEIVVYKDDLKNALLIQLQPYNIEEVVVVGFTIKRTNQSARQQTKTIPLLQQRIMDTASKFFKVFPNPVSPGASLHIEWKKTDEGYYTLDLVDISGKKVFSKEIWIDAEARLLNLEIPSVSAGVYFLRVNNKEGKSFTEKVVIE